MRWHGAFWKGCFVLGNVMLCCALFLPCNAVLCCAVQCCASYRAERVADPSRDRGGDADADGIDGWIINSSWHEARVTRLATGELDSRDPTGPDGVLRGSTVVRGAVSGTRMRQTTVEVVHIIITKGGVRVCVDGGL